MRKCALAGGRGSVISSAYLNSTLQDVSENIWGGKIGITVTEYWFIFDQRCLVWPFDRSSRVIDSCSETARLQLGSELFFFPPVCEILQMPFRSTGGTWFFSDYLSHALLSGYSDRFIKLKNDIYLFFKNHICSHSTYFSFKSHIIYIILYGFSLCSIWLYLSLISTTKWHIVVLISFIN